MNGAMALQFALGDESMLYQRLDAIKGDIAKLTRRSAQSREPTIHRYAVIEETSSLRELLHTLKMKYELSIQQWQSHGGIKSPILQEALYRLEMALVSQKQAFAALSYACSTSDEHFKHRAAAEAQLCSGEKLWTAGEIDSVDLLGKDEVAILHIRASDWHWKAAALATEKLPLLSSGSDIISLKVRCNDGAVVEDIRNEMQEVDKVISKSHSSYWLHLSGAWLTYAAHAYDLAIENANDYACKLWRAASSSYVAAADAAFQHQLPLMYRKLKQAKYLNLAAKAHCHLHELQKRHGSGRVHYLEAARSAFAAAATEYSSAAHETDFDTEEPERHEIRARFSLELAAALSDASYFASESESSIAEAVAACEEKALAVQSLLWTGHGFDARDFHCSFYSLLYWRWTFAAYDKLRAVEEKRKKNSVTFYRHAAKEYQKCANMILPALNDLEVGDENLKKSWNKRNIARWSEFLALISKFVSAERKRKNDQAAQAYRSTIDAVQKMLRALFSKPGLAMFFFEIGRINQRIGFLLSSTATQIVVPATISVDLLKATSCLIQHAADAYANEDEKLLKKTSLLYDYLLKCSNLVKQRKADELPALYNRLDQDIRSVCKVLQDQTECQKCLQTDSMALNYARLDTKLQFFSMALDAVRQLKEVPTSKIREHEAATNASLAWLAAIDAVDKDNLFKFRSCLRSEALNWMLFYNILPSLPRRPKTSEKEEEAAEMFRNVCQDLVQRAMDEGTTKDELEINMVTADLLNTFIVEDFESANCYERSRRFDSTSGSDEMNDDSDEFVEAGRERIKSEIKEITMEADRYLYRSPSLSEQQALVKHMYVLCIKCLKNQLSVMGNEELPLGDESNEEDCNDLHKGRRPHNYVYESWARCAASFRNVAMAVKNGSCQTEIEQRCIRTLLVIQGRLESSCDRWISNIKRMRYESHEQQTSGRSATREAAIAWIDAFELASPDALKDLTLDKLLLALTGFVCEYNGGEMDNLLHHVAFATRLEFIRDRIIEAQDAAERWRPQKKHNSYVFDDNGDLSEDDNNESKENPYTSVVKAWEQALHSLPRSDSCLNPQASKTFLRSAQYALKQYMQCKIEQVQYEGQRDVERINQQQLSTVLEFDNTIADDNIITLNCFIASFQCAWLRYDAANKVFGRRDVKDPYSIVLEKLLNNFRPEAVFSTGPTLSAYYFLKEDFLLGGLPLIEFELDVEDDDAGGMRCDYGRRCGRDYGSKSSDGESVEMDQTFKKEVVVDRFVAAIKDGSESEMIKERTILRCLRRNLIEAAKEVYTSPAALAENILLQHTRKVEVPNIFKPSDDLPTMVEKTYHTINLLDSYLEHSNDATMFWQQDGHVALQQDESYERFRDIPTRHSPLDNDEMLSAVFTQVKKCFAAHFGSCDVLKSTATAFLTPLRMIFKIERSDNQKPSLQDLIAMCIEVYQRCESEADMGEFQKLLPCLTYRKSYWYGRREEERDQEAEEQKESKTFISVSEIAEKRSGQVFTAFVNLDKSNGRDVSSISLAEEFVVRIERALWLLSDRDVDKGDDGSYYSEEENSIGKEDRNDMDVKAVDGSSAQIEDEMSGAYLQQRAMLDSARLLLAIADSVDHVESKKMRCLRKSIECLDAAAVDYERIKFEEHQHRAYDAAIKRYHESAKCWRRSAEILEHAESFEEESVADYFQSAAAAYRHQHPILAEQYINVASLMGSGSKSANILMIKEKIATAEGYLKAASDASNDFCSVVLPESPAVARARVSAWQDAASSILRGDNAGAERYVAFAEQDTVCSAYELPPHVEQRLEKKKLKSDVGRSSRKVNRRIRYYDDDDDDDDDDSFTADSSDELKIKQSTLVPWKAFEHWHDDDSVLNDARQADNSKAIKCFERANGLREDRERIREQLLSRLNALQVEVDSGDAIIDEFQQRLHAWKTDIKTGVDSHTRDGYRRCYGYRSKPDLTEEQQSEKEKLKALYEQVKLRKKYKISQLQDRYDDDAKAQAPLIKNKYVQADLWIRAGKAFMRVIKDSSHVPLSPEEVALKAVAERLEEAAIALECGDAIKSERAVLRAEYYQQTARAIARAEAEQRRAQTHLDNGNEKLQRMYNRISEHFGAEADSFQGAADAADDDLELLRIRAASAHRSAASALLAAAHQEFLLSSPAPSSKMDRRSAVKYYFFAAQKYSEIASSLSVIVEVNRIVAARLENEFDRAWELVRAAEYFRDAACEHAHGYEERAIDCRRRASENARRSIATEQFD